MTALTAEPTPILRGAQPHQPLIDHLRQQIRNALDPHIPHGAALALLDFPDHANVGDSAIWLGEIAYLKERAARIVYACSKSSLCEKTLRKRLPQGGIILIHGGGNFGDMWPAHHQFLHRVLRSFPDVKVIQLPQTVYWSDQEACRADFEVTNRHPNFHMFVRDRVSLDIFQKHSHHPVELCPDAAFFLELTRPEKPSLPVVAMIRTDKESNGTALPLAVAPEDWICDSRSYRFRAVRSVYRKVRHHQSVGPRIHLMLLNQLARMRIDRGCTQISRGHVVVTDRLHVHILCCLLGIPHVILDNAYGKLSTFREIWTHNFPHQLQINEPQNLHDAVSQLGAMARCTLEAIRTVARVNT